MKAWSHLPNAHHIDWVLESLKENIDLWVEAWYAVPLDAARGSALSEALDAALDAARSAVWALIAYDDCDCFLDMSYEKLKMWAILSEDPRAVLLLPMVYV